MIRRRRFANAPQSSWVLNKASPQWHGLYLLYNAARDHGGRGLQDPVAGRNGTYGWPPNLLTTVREPFGLTLGNTGNDDINTPTSVNLTDHDFTFTIWVYFNAVNTQIPEWKSINGWDSPYIHSANTSGSVYAGIDIATRLTPTELPNGTFATGSWNHYAFTFKYNGGNANTGSFYKNGALVGSGTMNDPSEDWGGFQAGNINGLFWDMRLYDTAKTATEVWNMFDPDTRFDLYLPVQRVWNVKVPAAAPAGVDPIPQIHQIPGNMDIVPSRDFIVRI